MHESVINKIPNHFPGCEFYKCMFCLAVSHMNVRLSRSRRALCMLIVREGVVDAGESGKFPASAQSIYIDQINTGQFTVCDLGIDCFAS